MVNEQIGKDELLRSMVIEQIRKDIAAGDVTAIDELLRFVPQQYLLGFLSEFENSIDSITE
jgi:hypothetical protein